MTVLTQSLAQALIDEQGLDIVIPNTYAVIGKNAFSGKGIKSVVIPESITVIGRNAFYANQLVSVSIPSSVKHIDGSAFYANVLTSVEFAEGLISIGTNAFYSNSLREINIPNSVVFIDMYAFYENNVKNISLPDSLTSLPNHVFPSVAWSYVTEAQTINVPQNPLFNLQALPYNAQIIHRTSTSSSTFVDRIPPTVVTSLDIAPKVLTKELAQSLIDELGLNVVIPEIYTSIADKAFSGKGLVSVSIPESITMIGESAFESNDLYTVDIPNSVTSIGRFAFSNNNLFSVKIPHGITSIPQYAFSGNPLISVNISNTVTSIGYGPFYDTNLITIDIPDSVTSIGDDAFRYNDNLHSISIPAQSTFDLSWLTSGAQINKRTVSPVSRLHNTSEGKHLFSSNQNEIDILTSSGWKNEGTVYYEPGVATADIFRFYVSSENRHFYTALSSERDLIINNQGLVDAGWQYEGKAFTAYNAIEYIDNAVAVVRYLNQGTGSHLYSTSTYEQSLLDQDTNWLNEGIAWYGNPMT
ncbi:leucine-rich repeat domain-containing protein [Synechococcus sp. WH 8109]|uniref:leucine-rich repeat domain-containing protein n=1 Tax=Synechococcus sp. WH 8109 TaxID=166314 RepID=UPI0008FF7F0E|nr:leucine-rich repeat domain-containing protein [Synechococcus sp. WH 8109]